MLKDPGIYLLLNSYILHNLLGSKWNAEWPPPLVKELRGILCISG